MHKAQEQAFEGPEGPVRFNKAADETLKDIFRDTRYNQRRMQRLVHWRDKKYHKYQHQAKSYDTLSRRFEYEH